MKRIIFTVLISLSAFVITSVVVRSRGKQALEPYLEVNGWTLKRNNIITVTGKEPRIIARDVQYIAADNRRKQLTYRFNEDGTEFCHSVVMYIPGIGAFAERSKERKLVYIDDYHSTAGDVSAGDYRGNPDYIADDHVLGYKCAHTQVVLPDGSMREAYEAYNFAKFPIKTVSRNLESIQTWEPVSIEIGPIPESSLAYHAEYPVEFGYFEDRIKRYESNDTGQEEYKQRIERMKAKLAKAKERFASK